MDSSQLRIILIVFGVLLVAGIYLWDRYKRRHARPRPQAHVRPPQRRVEPALQDQPVDDVPPMPAGVMPRVVDAQDDDAPGSDGQVGDDPDTWASIDTSGDPQISMNLSFNVHADPDYLNLDPALYDELPRKILQINIVARAEGQFEGPAIVNAMARVDMQHGDMDIFHRVDQAANGRTLFSIASMLEPGTFPLKSMAGFRTPGLVMFTQLPGPRDGLAVYADMLFTAERLASLLQADLQDDTHSKLSKQGIEHTRAQILEHRRQLQLARSRR